MIRARPSIAARPTGPPASPRPPRAARSLGRPPRRRLAAALAAAALGVAGPACDRPPIDVSEPPVRLVHDAPGRGPEVRPGLVACIAYVVRYPDGRVLMRDAETCLTVGAENVIDGLRQAILGMRAGGRRVAELPPHSHWGRPGHGPIPPNTTLRLEVEVLSVHPPGWRPADASPSPWDVAEAR